MSFSRNKLYALLAVACLAGYIWLYAGLISAKPAMHSFEVCLIKHTTNIPCPSCGSTRSVIALMHGHFQDALYINPLGYIIAIIMLLTPFWIIADLARKSKTLFNFYRTIEYYLTKPKYAVPLALLIIINWIWNIKKGL